MISFFSLIYLCFKKIPDQLNTHRYLSKLHYCSHIHWHYRYKQRIPLYSDSSYLPYNHQRYQYIRQNLCIFARSLDILFYSHIRMSRRCLHTGRDRMYCHFLVKIKKKQRELLLNFLTKNMTFTVFRMIHLGISALTIFTETPRSLECIYSCYSCQIARFDFFNFFLHCCIHLSQHRSRIRFPDEIRRHKGRKCHRMRFETHNSLRNCPR